MRTHSWILYLGVTVVMFTGLSGAMFVFGKNRMTVVANLDTDIRSLNIARIEYIHKANQREVFTKGGEQVRQYRKNWEARRSSFDTRDKIIELLRAETMVANLNTSDDSDQSKNTVTEVMPRTFRIEWHTIGQAQQLLRFIKAIEVKMDFLQVEDTTWEVRDDGTLDMSVIAMMRLP